MNKEQILEMSRKENKNRDVYEQEVLKQCGTAAYAVMAILATVLYAAQIMTGGGTSPGFYAIVASGQMATFWVKWFKLRRKHELAVAIFFTIIVIVFLALHINYLVSTSTIL